MSKKLLKVTFEYEDEIRWLDGDDADRWLKAADGMAIMEANHGRPFPEFKWKKKLPNGV